MKEWIVDIRFEGNSAIVHFDQFLPESYNILKVIRDFERRAVGKE